MSCHKSGAIRKFDVQTYEFVSRLRIKNSGRIKVRDFACSTLVTRQNFVFSSACATIAVQCDLAFTLCDVIGRCH